jgi:glucosamine--fructose-6-phosphate aminotransferase (isomerizing)
MEYKSPNLVYDQMKTFKKLYSDELPSIMNQRPIFMDASFLQKLHTVYVIGDGDSLYAAKAIEYAFRDITGIDYQPVPAFEFTQYIIEGITKEQAETSLLIGVSASGSSPFVVDAMVKFREAFPNSHVVSVCGKLDGQIEKVATEKLSVQIEELGRTPGIRTYVASMVGLLAIACEIIETKVTNCLIHRDNIVQFLKETANSVEKTIDEAREKSKLIANFLDDSFIAFTGTGPSHGTAMFEAAKFVETSGVYAFGQDMEEWNHVEGFAYPLTSLLVVHLNPGPTYKRAETLAISAGALGHKIVVIAPEKIKDIAIGDTTIILYGPYDEWLSPLTQFIPFTLIAAIVAEKHKRAMFLTDTDIWSKL